MYQGLNVFQLCQYTVLLKWYLRVFLISPSMLKVKKCHFQNQVVESFDIDYITKILQ